MWYWVSDVSESSSSFAFVVDGDDGVCATAYYAPTARVGVRPFALLV